MNKDKQILLIWILGISVVILSIVIFSILYLKDKVNQNITNFEECVGAGYPVMESYPRQCKVPNGPTFVENIPGLNTNPAIIPDVKSVSYKNDDYKISFWYPETAQLKTSGFDSFVTGLKLPVIAVSLPKEMFAGTNLKEAVVAFGIDTSASAVTNCYRLDNAEVVASSTKNVNGIEFRVFESTDAGAGNLYESKTYRFVKGDYCYEINEVLHSTNIYNYEPGTIKEYDKTKFVGILERIVSTFVFIK